MANASIVGYGCRQTMTVGNTPATGGQSEFLVQGGAAPGATVAIFKGSPSSNANSSRWTLLGNSWIYSRCNQQQAMTDGIVSKVVLAWSYTLEQTLTQVLGVFNGATFVDATGKPSWTNGLAAAQTSAIDYNTGNNNITAFVNTNPAQEYTVRADAALTNASFNTITNVRFQLK